MSDVFLRKHLGVIDDSHGSPHIAGGIFGNALSLMGQIIEGFFYIRRHPPAVIILRIPALEKGIRQRLESAFVHQLHDHVVRRAYQIKYIAQTHLIVKLFIGSKGGVFYFYLYTIGLLVPFLKIIDQGILS